MIASSKFTWYTSRSELPSGNAARWAQILSAQQTCRPRCWSGRRGPATPIPRSTPQGSEVSPGPWSTWCGRRCQVGGLQQRQQRLDSILKRGECIWQGLLLFKVRPSVTFSATVMRSPSVTSPESFCLRNESISWHVWNDELSMSEKSKEITSLSCEILIKTQESTNQRHLKCSRITFHKLLFNISQCSWVPMSS